MSISLYSINAFFILDSEGKRVLAKYYTRAPDSYSAKNYSTMVDQKKLEKAIFKKTAKGKIVVLYRKFSDVLVYIIGSADENELLLNSVLEGFCNTLVGLFNQQIDKRAIVEDIDSVAIVLDEIIDDGIILEVNTEIILSRVTKKASDTSDIQLNEQSLFQAYNTAKERLTRSLLS
ncbi:Golgi-to-ER vesicle coat component [Entomophthora muscae]|uniref:Golgi-to-ER vesicle coat component n=1 Tax=Entomophthora muscae TaxID=34485 RepID=A0ACC2UUB2_9FUNG|nr:Golgi-to-ER vesicle coat component [Entomophthora muscae]